MPTWKRLLLKFASKFKSPSSWAGIAAMASLLGWKYSPDEWEIVVEVGVGIAGMLAFFLNENGNGDNDKSPFPS